MMSRRVAVACLLRLGVAAASLEAYFDIAARVWTDPESSAAKCLAVQRREGWLPVKIPRGRFASSFDTLGTEGAGHHWLASLPVEACGASTPRGSKIRRCGGLGSFSKCGDCCDTKEVGKSKIKFKRRHGVDYAWRCFADDKANWPGTDPATHHVVLVRDALTSFESILRRFWQFRRGGGEVDTLAREESFFAAAHNRVEARVKKLDCRRTLFFDFEVARRAPKAHGAALAVFLGLPEAHAGIRDWFGDGGDDERNASAVAAVVDAVDCFERVKPWLPRLRAYAAWLDGGGLPADPGCPVPVEPVVRACLNATDDDRACATAWRDRAFACVDLLRSDGKHATTAPPHRPFARCRR